MVADRCFPSSLVHLKKYLQQASSFDNDLRLNLFANFFGREQVFSGFFQSSEVLIGGTFFFYSKHYFIVFQIVRLYIVLGNKSSVA